MECGDRRRVVRRPEEVGAATAINFSTDQAVGGAGGAGGNGSGEDAGGAGGGLGTANTGPGGAGVGGVGGPGGNGGRGEGGGFFNGGHASFTAITLSLSNDQATGGNGHPGGDGGLGEGGQCLLPGRQWRRRPGR